MDDLVGELLALSRLESGVIKLERERVNLNELLTTVLEDARFEGEARKITIDYVPQVETSDIPISLLGQQDLLHRAIDNVVTEARPGVADLSSVRADVRSDSAQDGQPLRYVGRLRRLAARQLLHRHRVRRRIGVSEHGTAERIRHRGPRAEFPGLGVDLAVLALG